MRRILVLLTASLLLISQGPIRKIPPRKYGSMHADGAESAVKQSAQQFVEFKKLVDRDVEALAHLREADKALTDPMQPNNAVQKAYEELDKAYGLTSDVFVKNGILKAEKDVDNARHSAMMADFGRLRSAVQSYALGPQARVVIREALRLQDETAAWLRVQMMITDHVKNMTDLASSNLRAAEQQ